MSPLDYHVWRAMPREIPQAATKAKNDKRFEGRIAIGIGRFTLKIYQKGFIRRLRTCVGHTGGAQVKHML